MRKLLNISFFSTPVLIILHLNATLKEWCVCNVIVVMALNLHPNMNGRLLLQDVVSGALSVSFVP